MGGNTKRCASPTKAESGSKELVAEVFKSKKFLRNNPLWFFISNYNFQVQIQTLKTASGGGEQQRDAAGDMDVLRSLEEGPARSKGPCRML